MPTLFAIIACVLGLCLALQQPKTPIPAGPGVTQAGASGSVPANPAAIWRPTKHLVPGIPADMIEYRVSFRDVPVGAIPQEPRIQMVPGQPTDIKQRPMCQCGGPLGWTPGGWYCLNPNCVLRDPSIPRIIHGIGP